jgi:hypothetical protein
MRIATHGWSLGQGLPRLATHGWEITEAPEVVEALPRPSRFRYRRPVGAAEVLDRTPMVRRRYQRA